MRRRAWVILAILVLSFPCCAADYPSARDTLAAIRKARLDPRQLYRVHDASMYKEELRLYLNDGTLAFLEPVRGKVTGAVFIGSGEVLMIPPNPIEKKSLAQFTGSPVLNEKFVSALFRFTDDTYERLREAIAQGEGAEPIENQAIIDEWNPVVGNLHGALETRVLMDLLSEKPKPFFQARLNGERLGTFEISLDYRSFEQMGVGQAVTKDERVYGDIWCSFVVRSMRDQPAPHDPLLPRRYSLDSRILPDHSMRVKADVEINPGAGGDRVIQFELSRFLRVSQVEMVRTGSPPVDVEFSQNALLEEAEVRRRGNDQLTVILPAPIVAGQPFTLRFHYEGEVIEDAGNGVLFVGARGSWYPNRGLRPALFEMTFACPARQTLVASGERVEEKEEGEWRVSRWTSRVPVRVAGFNLGEYVKGEAQAGDVHVEVYNNKYLEPELERRRAPAVMVGPSLDGRTGRGERPDASLIVAGVVPGPSPGDVAGRVARDTVENIEFYTRSFGTLPYGRVAISPIPGNFGQGWPQLVYLSTLAFFIPFDTESGGSNLSRTVEIFYRQLLRSHELAHQWWGNVLVPGSYRDEWLSEALANYSALMYLQTLKNGEGDMKAVMDRYRRDLMQKVEDEPAEHAGPPVLGYRLTSSRSPNGVELIMYKKGTWIIHMLRELMREPKTGSDANFIAFLHALREQYERKPFTTEEFRKTAERFVNPALNLDGKRSLEWFFDQWIYSTGIPEITARTTSTSRAGKGRVKGTVTMAGVDEGFALPLRVYAETPRGRVLLGVVSAIGNHTDFSLPAPASVQKVVVDASEVLATTH